MRYESTVDFRQKAKALKNYKKKANSFVSTFAAWQGIAAGK
jgi:hypothetical protein